MVSRKKVAVLLDFVQMRGGGALPNLFVNIMGRGRAKAKYYGVGRAKQRKNGQFIKEKMTKIDFSMTFL